MTQAMAVDGRLATKEALHQLVGRLLQAEKQNRHVLLQYQMSCKVESVGSLANAWSRSNDDELSPLQARRDRIQILEPGREASKTEAAVFHTLLDAIVESLHELFCSLGLVAKPLIGDPKDTPFRFL